MPEVTVIIPNYNHAPYLEERINSVLNQTYQDFEIIILDDFSSDNSREIIERYRSNPKVSAIVFNNMNSGSTFKQWEKGINLARGQYVWIAESDDWCEVTLLQYLVQGIKMRPDCTISYCQSYAIEGRDAILWHSYHPLLQDIQDGTLFIKNHMIFNNSIFNASMAIWRKECFSFISREFTSYKYCGDWLFWVELSLKGTVCISGRVLNYFRNHPDDVSTKANLSGLNFIENLKMINWLYERKLVTDQEYWRAFKLQHRQYWISRHKIPTNSSRELKKIFYSPLSPKTTRIKLIADSIWKHLK